MSQVQIFNRSFLRGLETTREEGGAPDWSGFRIFKNTRVGKDGAERRGGMAVIATMPEVGSSAVFTTTGAQAVAHKEVWRLNRPEWALDFLVHPTGDGTLLDAGSMEIARSSGDWVVTIGTIELRAPAPTEAQHIAVARGPDGYALIVEGVVADSSPYSPPSSADATLTLGAMAASLDFLRLRAPGPTSWKARRLRLLNPRGRGVLCCYRDAQDANNILWDHSIYEAHAKCSAMDPAGSRLDDVRHVPVQAIDTYIDENDRRRLFIVAGGKEYDGPFS